MLKCCRCCDPCEDGREVPPGKIGEVVGHSPIIMNGYYKRPKQTAEAEWYDPTGKGFDWRGHETGIARVVCWTNVILKWRADKGMKAAGIGERNEHGCRSEY
jgi:acyl-CoA synthetase (AMP-forming)/AMP-acid ligase II